MGRKSRRDGRERVLLGLLLFTGVTAVIGGLLLFVRPDGSLLQAKSSALVGTPFDDWRAPGVFLAVLAGGGALAAFAWSRAGLAWSREVACAYGAGLFAFELVEWAWIGLQPLEGVFAAVAAAVVVLALTSRTIRGVGTMRRGSFRPGATA